MLLDSASEEKQKGKIMIRLHISYRFPSVAWLPIYPLCVCTCTRPIRACPPMRNSPGMLLGSREEEVLGVKAGDPVLQRRLLLQRCAAASGCRASKAQTGAGAGTLLGGEAGHEAQRKIMGTESSIKSKANL